MCKYECVVDKVGNEVAKFFDRIVVIADECEINRDVLIAAAVKTAEQLAEIGTFENYKVSENK